MYYYKNRTKKLKFLWNIALRFPIGWLPLTDTTVNRTCPFVRLSSDGVRRLFSRAPHGKTSEALIRRNAMTPYSTEILRRELISRSSYDVRPSDDHCSRFTTQRVIMRRNRRFKISSSTRYVRPSSCHKNSTEMASPDFTKPKNLFHSASVADSKGGAVGAAAPYWLNFFPKSRLFPCKRLIDRCVHLRLRTGLTDCLPPTFSKFLDPPLFSASV